MPVLFKEGQECLSHLWQSILLFCRRVAKESVASAFVGAGFVTGFLRLVLRPKVFAAFLATLAREAFLLKEWQLVSFCWERFFNHEDASIVAEVYCVVKRVIDSTD
jgi:hypothetical protein